MHHPGAIRPMTVYFFIGTLSKGGAERTVSTLSQHLPSDIEIKIILFGTATRIDYPVRGELLYLDQTKVNTPFNKALTIWVARRKFRRLKQKGPGRRIYQLPRIIRIC
jgi:hypothetical protein